MLNENAAVFPECKVKFVPWKNGSCLVLQNIVCTERGVWGMVNIAGKGREVKRELVYHS